jgi:hypothetical protein
MPKKIEPKPGTEWRLFIGGSRDGQWMEIAKDKFQVHIVRGEFSSSAGKYEVEVYSRVSLKDGNSHYFVMLYSKAPEGEIIARLLNGYSSATQFVNEGKYI